MRRLLLAAPAFFFSFLPGAQAANFTVTGAIAVSISNLAAHAGSITLNAGSGLMSGPGYLASAGATRGQILINRTSAVTVTVLGVSPPSGIDCGGTNVPISSVPFDDTACSVAATGGCTIYIGLVLSAPSTLPVGNCVLSTPLSITVN